MSRKWPSWDRLGDWSVWRRSPTSGLWGPGSRSDSEEAATAIRARSSEALAAFRNGETVEIEVGGERFPLDEEELEVVEEAQGGLVVQGDGSFTAALDPALDESLRERAWPGSW